MNKQEIGKIGEDSVAYYVDKIGCNILERNYRIDSGEIDIIFVESDCLVFGEVKTRQSISYGIPCEAVNQKKRNKIITVAKHYVVNNNAVNMDIRFDVFEVYFKERKIRHIRNAYYAT